MANDKIFYAAAKALIEDEQGRILLFYAGPAPWRAVKEPYWDLPGGRLRDDQDFLAALKVEMEEETGVTDIGQPELLTVVLSNHDVPFLSDRLIGLVLAIYRVTIPIGSEITKSHEHETFEWVPKLEAAKRLTNKYPPEFTDVLARGKY